MLILSPLKAKNLIRDSVSRRISGGLSKSNKNSQAEEPESDELTYSSRSSHDEKSVVKELQDFCHEHDIKFLEETIYRFAVFYKFDLELSRRAIQQNKANDYLNLELTGSMRRQIATRVIFPLSGLQTRKEKMEVCYIHASRIFDLQVAEGSPTHHRMIENLCYILNDFSRTKEQCVQGVAVIISMKHCDKSKFSLDLWMQVMMALQGNLVPTIVKSVLLVDSPKWFHNNIWKTQARTTLAPSFVRKFRLIEGSHLLNGEYFADGCMKAICRQVWVDGNWRMK